MAWLERLDDRNARRLGRQVQRNVVEAGHLAQDHLSEFAGQAGALAGRTVRQVSDYGRHEGADLLRDRAQRFARDAGEVAGELADYGRREGALLAEAAAVQATRVTRAVKADPVPVIVGAVGIALFASLVFGRRRR